LPEGKVVKDDRKNNLVESRAGKRNKIKKEGK